MKTNIIFCLIIVAILFSSCTKKNDLSITDPKAEKPESLQQISKSELADFKISYKIEKNSTIEGITNNKVSSLTKLYETFLPFILKKFDKTKGEFVSFTITDNKTKGILEITDACIYKPLNMSPMEAAFFYTFGGVDVTARSAEAEEESGGKKRRYIASCEGGKNDGKTYEFPDTDNKIMQKYYGTKVASFSVKCLDGGGCVNICKVEVVVN